MDPEFVKRLKRQQPHGRTPDSPKRKSFKSEDKPRMPPKQINPVNKTKKKVIYGDRFIPSRATLHSQK